MYLGGMSFACDPSCQLDPDLFSGLSALRWLSLSKASFAISLPALDVSALQSLSLLDLSSAYNVQGPLPPEWPSQLVKLTSLRLSGLPNIVSVSQSSCSSRLAWS